MAFIINNLNDYDIGYTKGIEMAKKGIPEIDALELERNEDIREGIKEGYFAVLNRAFRDSARSYKINLKKLQDSNMPVLKAIILHDACDCIDIANVLKAVTRSHLRMQIGDSLVCIKDAEEYTLEKVNNKHYKVLKNGEHVYDLEQKQSRWVCNCTGFKYRHRCKHIALLQDILPKRHPRSEFEGALSKVAEVFDGFKYEIVGSWRRGKETFKDVDILVECSKSDMNTILERLQQDNNYIHVMSGPDIIRGKYKGYDFDVSRTNPGEWGSFLLYRTGSGDFNIAMRGWLKKFGYSLNEHGLFDAEGNKLASDSEEEIFEAIGIPYIKPEDRENTNALRKELSKLKSGPVKGHSSQWISSQEEHEHLGA